MTRILVVEDNTSLARGLRNNLEIEGYEVEVARTGAKGLSAARTNRPDLVILDLMLPEMDGYRVLQSLRQEGFQAPVLVLTARSDQADKVRGFRFGADDYVTKPFGLLELLARIQALLRRSGGLQEAARPAAASLEKFGDVAIDPASRTVRRGEREIVLTATQFDLLLALVRRRGAVATRHDLLRDVWGYQSGVMSRTIDTHVAELRRKLEADPSAPRHIVTVRRIGYRLRD